MARLKREGGMAGIFLKYLEDCVGHFSVLPDEERCLHQGSNGLRDVRCFHGGRRSGAPHTYAH